MTKDNFKEILETTTSLAELAKTLCPTFGIIHRTEHVKYGEEVGLLVWDYIVYNEISFISMDKKIVHRLFTSTSDEKTEEEFNRLAKQFKVIV